MLFVPPSQFVKLVVKVLKGKKKKQHQELLSPTESTAPEVPEMPRLLSGPLIL